MDVNNQILFGALVVGASVIVNIFLLLIFRLRDNKRHSLKMVNDKIKSYRDEVAASSNRIREESLQAEARVSSVCKEGDEMVERVAEALDAIATYQQDLNALSNTCVSYHNTLEKLRNATEQAEARLQFVQEEVRKVESVDEFVKRAEADFNRLQGQLQTTRAEYVKLVTATEGDLRAKAEAQRNENQDMLQSFVVELENFRSSFSAFALGQRSEFSAFASEELDKAREESAQMEERHQSALSQVEEMEGRLLAGQEELAESLSDMTSRSEALKEQAERAKQSMKALADEEKLALEDAFSEMEKEKEQALQGMSDSISQKLSDADSELSMRAASFSESAKELSDKASGLLEDVKGQLDAALEKFSADFQAREEQLSAGVDALLSKAGSEVDARSGEFRSSCGKLLEESETVLREKSDDVNALLKEVSEKIKEEERLLKELLDETKAEADRVTERTGAAAAEAVQNVTNARVVLDQSLSGFTVSANDLLAKSFESMDASLDKRWKKVSADLDSMTNLLNDSVSDTKETITQLSVGETERIRETVEKLSELEEKVRSSNEQLLNVTQEVTAARESLFDIKKEKSGVEKQLEDRNNELKELQASISAQKQEKIKAEAALLRLKTELKNLEKSRGKSEPAPARSKRFEDMIEEFPDEFLTGEVVEVDLSDEV